MSHNVGLYSMRTEVNTKEDPFTIMWHQAYSVTTFLSL